MIKTTSMLAILFCALAMAACAPKPVLPERSATNPIGVDLSGIWHLRKNGGQALTRSSEEAQTIQMPKRVGSSPPSPAEQRRRARSSGKNSLDIWVFLETGKRLRVTQTIDGLFISFDRAVVEEYTFGENRIVSVGPIEAQRVSGWIGSDLVLETMDEHGAVLTETWWLRDDGAVLVRDVVVTKGENRLFTAQQVFDPE